MSYSHSQAMAQGTGTNLKLWFCFTGKDYDITIKTSHSGWRLKSFLKSQFSKVVKKNVFIEKKQAKTSENHFKIHQKVRKVAFGARCAHTHAHPRSPSLQVSWTCRCHYGAAALRSFALSQEKGPADGRCNIFQSNLKSARGSCSTNIFLVM